MPQGVVRDDERLTQAHSSRFESAFAAPAFLRRCFYCFQLANESDE